MTESVFDQFVDNYEDACGRGLALSGETRDYFAQQRVMHTRALCAATPVRRVLDFGCGLGHTTPYLLKTFPDATVVGVDTSEGAIDRARQLYGNERAHFATVAQDAAFDLAYTNGTFHHIEPVERPAVMQYLFKSLNAGGLFALWENNPWNPGTRMVMRRIPFDRDAKTLTYREATELLRGAGFEVGGTYFYFYFPSWLKRLRGFERTLVSVPFGAQYCVIGRKPT